MIQLLNDDNLIALWASKYSDLGSLNYRFYFFQFFSFPIQLH